MCCAIYLLTFPLSLMISSMESHDHQLHIFLVPFMAQGHLIPMIDIARLLAARGVTITIITTPLNARLFHNSIDPNIKLHLLRFPCSEAGLPEGCESVDSLRSEEMTRNFTKAIMMLHQPFEQFFQQHHPTAIISDMCIPWTADVARKFNVPRITFYVSGCFALSISDAVRRYSPHTNVDSDSEPFLVPGLPDQIHITRAQMPESSAASHGQEEFFSKVGEAELASYGVVVNTFYEMEPAYVDRYRKVSGKKVWTIGPVSLSNKDNLGKAVRGKQATIDHERCLSWLDSKEPESVIYVCFGSICNFSQSQLLEIASGLEASNHPFIWVVRDCQDHLLDSFEERTKGRGLVIKGWAPQLLILSHRAVGGFVTHCGWNSVMEGVSAGVPMIAWPLGVEQFYNEKLVVEILKIGIGVVGVGAVFKWGDEEKADSEVKKEEVEMVVRRLMEGGDEVERMRKRARELCEMAKWATEGGSSHHNVGVLIEDLMRWHKERLG